MNTKTVGEHSEGQVLAALLRAKKIVLLPFGDNQRYDIVIHEKYGFRRIQVKTGRLKNGAITASTASTYGHRGRKRKGYEGEADYFAIYCPDNDKTYMVPVKQVGLGGIRLRVNKPLVKSTRTNFAHLYEFRPDYEFIAM